MMVLNINKLVDEKMQCTPFHVFILDAPYVGVLIRCSVS